MEKRFKELELFPLGTVLYPNNLLPLRIFEPRYVDLIGRCMRDGSGFGVVGILEGNEAGTPATPFEFGTVANIIDFDQGEDGLLNIVARGAQRFHITSTSARADNLLVAAGEYLDDVEDCAIPAKFSDLQRLLNDIAQHLELSELSRSPPETAVALAYALAQYLPLPKSMKVELLGNDDALSLLGMLSQAIQRLQKS